MERIFKISGYPNQLCIYVEMITESIHIKDFSIYFEEISSRVVRISNTSFNILWDTKTYVSYGNSLHV